MMKGIFGVDVFQPFRLMYGRFAISWDDAPSYDVSGFQPEIVNLINCNNLLQSNIISLKGLKIITWDSVPRNKEHRPKEA